MTPTSQEHHMTTTDTEPTRWRKKPVEVEAIQYQPHKNCGAVGAFTGLSDGDYECQESENDEYAIETLEGVMWAQPGDWIIRGVAGEFYPCKNEIFLATYEPADADVCVSEVSDGEAS